MNAVSAVRVFVASVPLRGSALCVLQKWCSKEGRVDRPLPECGIIIVRVEVSVAGQLVQKLQGVWLWGESLSGYITIT